MINSDKRIKFLYFILSLIFFLIIARLIYVVAFGDKVYVSKFYHQDKNKKRGNIFDRNGIVVATDLKAKSLYITTVLVKDPELMSRKLVTVFPELKYEDILKKIKTKKDRNWILVKRGVTPKEQEAVQELKMAGLIFDNDLVRVYPQKSILAHVVGYVDTDRNGLAGAEMAYDQELKLGQDVNLAVDIRLQDVLGDELIKGIEKYKAIAASGLIMDVNNGEVLAASSYPNFDPNRQIDASQDERFNRATYGVYELGSIFKIFTNTMAFEDNLVKTTDVFDITDPIKYDRFTIRDDHPEKGYKSVEEIFAKSSNIGTVKIAQKIGVKRQKEMLKEMGLLDKIEADFPALSRPIYPKTWREINLFTIAYGHGIAVTPLHMAMAVSGIVNGGSLIPPSFVKIGENKPSGKKIIKPATSEVMRKMLRNAVENGTGGYADIDGYEVGGKTGTAERAEFGTYDKNKTMASFIAVFPMSNPKYLVFVSFDRPNYSFNTGGMVAAPVAGNVIKGIAPILGIRPNIVEKEKKI